MPRPLYEIARDIRQDWRNVHFGARPYLAAMADLDAVSDSYGSDDGTDIVRRFLVNAQSWRGPVAKAIKAELNAMLKGRAASDPRVVRVADAHEARVAASKTAGRPDGDWLDNDPRAPKTIWGPAQFMYEIMRGVRWYSTAGHGGLAVADGVARKFLTPAAYKLGQKAGGYVWYEEDVAFALPLYEHPEWGTILKQKAGGSPITKEQMEIKIQDYYPQYFDMVGAGGTHPVKPRVGSKVVFLRDVRFGDKRTVPKGTEATVTKVTGSMIHLTMFLALPEGRWIPNYLVRLSLQDLGTDIALVS